MARLNQTLRISPLNDFQEQCACDSLYVINPVFSIDISWLVPFFSSAFPFLSSLFSCNTMFGSSV